ncbi:hypothetical protein L3556_07765 [Candidatus Synechococcus calcipolaris G9]|uniref:Uncharacterized protein n=1 Tax=Candidatus Synechococcus calcipolaris G9 TaxID=1497997 RepID=A0ABT6EYE5_9SYNE|nr:hypothetical protein [Candidatus Synechococcus calcipolaris]MDG2990826.1 hypothetical protein [Candidatus Synechococcus calcipolaris G9]
MTVQVTALALGLIGTTTAVLAEQKVELKDPCPIQIENWRGKAFYEILFMNRLADGSGVGFYYNSIGKDLEASNDVMDARFRALDADTLKKEYGSDGILFNGPRRLVTNGITGMAWDGCKERVVATIPYRVFGIFETPDLSKAVAGNLPSYQVLVSKRSNTFSFNAGETVYELITPEGAVYTMFSLSLKIDPDNTIENLPTLGERLNLPNGWNFRARQLEQDMTLTSAADSEPPNTIVLDELEGNYQYNHAASKPANVLSDGANAKSVRFDDLHGTRYIEMMLAGRSPETGEVVAAVYNSMFSARGIPASKDTSPQELLEGLDFEKLKEEFGVLGVSLNGPKFWTPDWSEFTVGVERNFNGIPASWIAQLNMGGDGSAGVEEATPPYQPITIARTSSIGWKKGTTVVLLDDPDGNTWIMKGFQLGLQPKHTYDDFIANGAAMYKELPEGWKVRVVTLEQDLIETPEGGVATIMPDEHFNVFDKTGPGMSNYKP